MKVVKTTLKPKRKICKPNKRLKHKLKPKQLPKLNKQRHRKSKELRTREESNNSRKIRRHRDFSLNNKSR